MEIIKNKKLTYLWGLVKRIVTPASGEPMTIPTEVGMLYPLSYHNKKAPHICEAFVNRGWEFSNHFVSDIMLLAGINQGHDNASPENAQILFAIQKRKVMFSEQKK